MDPGAIELRSGAGAIAERNEEINRRRLAKGHAWAGGPLRVTNPEALAKLMAEMQAKADQQRAAEEAREQERRRREGAAYRTPEQRAADAAAARAARGGGGGGGAGMDADEARVLEKRFNPGRDYYQLLGIPRSAAATEVRRAYKRLALLYHPDKYKDADAEQQAAVADKFKQVVEAFDVLSNEEQRGVYDKCRDFMDANPGRGLPTLSPAEAALMRSGIAELAQLRRQGAKSVKHPPLQREVLVSLEKLNSGGTKSVAVERRRVAPDGSELASVKSIHLVLRRGSREGDTHVFEGDGCESVDTLPGDLVLVLRQKPHPLYRRSGLKDLEHFAQALSPGDVLFAVEVPTIHRKRLLLTGSAFREAVLNGGAGGVWQANLPGQGLFDPAEPWEQPAGKLTVQLRYPPCLLAEARIATGLAPQPVHLLGCSHDTVAAALAAGSLAGMLNHRGEAAELVAEAAFAEHLAGNSESSVSSERESSASTDSQGFGCDGSTWSSGSSESSSRSSIIGTFRRAACPGVRRPTAVCLVVDAAGAGSCEEQSALNSGTGFRPGQPRGCSAAATAMLRVLRRHAPGLEASTAVSSCLLDDEWAALAEADVLIVDGPAFELSRNSTHTECHAKQQECLVAVAAQHLADSGLAELVWQRFWTGALVAGVGAACALLGRQAAVCSSTSAAAPPPVLPWYALRAGGGTAGWASLHEALSAAAAAAAPVSPPRTPGQPFVGVGVMRGGCWLVHPATGRAELLVAPSRQVLIDTAAWNSAPRNDPACQGLQEADDEYGFFCELAPAAS